MVRLLEAHGVEVIFGPQSALYGSNALGAVMRQTQDMVMTPIRNIR